MLRTRVLLIAYICVCLLGVSGCSVHPIPDDITHYSTRDIVWHVRCEGKQAVRDRIGAVLRRDPRLADIVPDDILKPRELSRIRRANPELAAKFQNYMNSAIAYNFEFTINENNTGSASAGLFVPFFSGGSLGAGAGGGIEKTRTGERRFNMEEKFWELVKLDCKHFNEPNPNLVYPMTGSIGMARIMDTFIDLTEMGGGKNSFTDTITFYTKLDGSANANLVLLPVTNQFRVIAAQGNLSTYRSDQHKLTVSLAFPLEDLRGESDDRAGEIRALENLCIARAEQREDENDTLRLYPPELYCRRSEQRSAQETDRRLLE